MKLGGHLEITLSEEEIMEKLMELWQQAIRKGNRSSPELYRSMCSDTLRYFVRQQRQGATLFIRRFTEKYTYEDMLPLFAVGEGEEFSDLLERSSDASKALLRGDESSDAKEQSITETIPDRVPESDAALPVQQTVQQKVTPRLAAAIKARQRERRKRMIGILLFLLVATLGAWSTRYLDDWVIEVPFDEIPDLVQTGIPAAGPWVEANQRLAMELWGETEPALSVVLAQHDQVEGGERWDLVFKSRICNKTMNRLDDVGVAASALRSFAARAGWQLASEPELETNNFMYLRYPVTTRIATAEAVRSISDTVQQGRLELGMSAVPEGIAALAIMRIRFVAESVVNELPPMTQQEIVRPFVGTTLFCDTPTLWGWYFDRARYVP